MPTPISPLTFRPATADDAAFIARHVLEALHWEMYQEPLSAAQQKAWRELTAVAQRPGVLYSYEHATIGLIDGEPAGLLVAYPGEGYHQMRRDTFALISAFSGTEVEAMEDETQSGEYYIDSLAVVPSFRNRGVGRGLLLQAVEQARHLALCPTLLVDPDNPRAQKLYTSAGFHREGEIFAFGQTYWRMISRP